MRRTVITLTLLATMIAMAPFALAADLGSAREPAECVRTFELVAPADWRCTEEPSPQCMVCRNRSPHYTELLVRCVDDGTRERHSMPPGATLSICGGQAL